MSKDEELFENTFHKILTDSEIYGEDISEAESYDDLDSSEKEDVLSDLDYSPNSDTAKKIKEKYNF